MGFWLVIADHIGNFRLQLQPIIDSSVQFEVNVIGLDKDKVKCIRVTQAINT